MASPETTVRSQSCSAASSMVRFSFVCFRRVSRYPFSLIAASPAASAATDTGQGCPLTRICSASSCDPQIAYPRRSPAMAKVLVNARSTIRRPNLPLSRRNGMQEWASGSSVNSIKHSSTTSRHPVLTHLSRISRSSSASVSFPVGLFGSHRNSMSVSGVIRSRIFSVRENSKAGIRSYITSHPPLIRARAYSVNVGTGSSALFGRAACTRRQMISAAPLPNTIFSGDT